MYLPILQFNLTYVWARLGLVIFIINYFFSLVLKINF